MNIILPVGSTSADLQTAVENATSGDTIIISSDMPFTGAVMIAAGKKITIQSNEENNWVMSSPSTMNTRHFIVRGDLVLQSIILDGENMGGGVNPQNGSFTMNRGSIIQNCSVNTSGGGVYAFFSTFTMNSGSVIQNCSVSFPTNNVDGGGVMLVGGTFTMNRGSAIQNCSANGSGGGVSASETGMYNMPGGTISGNRAGLHGGGVAINQSSSFNMDGVTISGNTAVQRGGGVYVVSRGSLTITRESHIVNNSAQNGGGIYTMDTNYANLFTGLDTRFSGNTASTAFVPPVDARTIYADIQFMSTSITDHPLNNFDINYSGAEPLTYQVTYDANGGTGSYKGPDLIPGGTDMVLSPIETGISRSDYTFAVWNTEPDGSGISYAPGDTITLTSNVTLYAQWMDAPIYTVTYGANGGSGSFVDPGRQYGTVYTIMSTSQTGISRPGFIFIGWNTEPDGSGISFVPGDIITITGDMRLYAQWRQTPVPNPKRMCPKPVMKCRTSIEGQKIWIDDNNIGDKRPDSVEILLLRDGDIYKRTLVNSENGWAFGFCCLPVYKNSGQKYGYHIDEKVVPDGYTKTIEGYNVINTLTP